MPRTYHGHTRRLPPGRKKRAGRTAPEAAPEPASVARQEVTTDGGAPRATAPSVASSMLRGATLEGMDYRYLAADLRHILLLSGALFGGLVLLALLLR